MSQGLDQDRLCLGVITGVHGVRGDVRIKPFTATPEAVANYGVLESENGQDTFEIARSRVAKGSVIATLKGVTSRNHAETLKGTMLYVPRARLPEPEEDEFYHADLIGMTVVLETGEILGFVTAVQNFGAGDLLEVTPEGAKAGILLPFTQAAVPKIEFADRVITATPAEEVE